MGMFFVPPRRSIIPVILFASPGFSRSRVSRLKMGILFRGRETRKQKTRKKKSIRSLTKHPFFNLLHVVVKKKKKKTANTTSKLAVAFAASLVVLLVLDGLWINVASKPLGFDYFATVERIQGGGRGMAKRPLGLLAYLSMAAACARAAERGGAAASAEAGFYIYSIYDLTNTFLFHGWSPALALADIAWGTSVFAVAGAAAAAAVAAVF